MAHRNDGGSAALMDGLYRHQRYIYDATRKYFLLGRDRLLDGLKPPSNGTILEIACGTGRNLILAARRYPEAQLYGFDISSVMLETARASIARSNHATRIKVAEGDATRFNGAELFGRRQFDRVFISYALSMIPPWRLALPQALNAVAPGGSLHIVDFGQQEELPAWFKGALFAWLGHFSVEPRQDLPEALETLARETGASLQFDRLYRGYAHHATLVRPRLH